MASAWGDSWGDSWGSSWGAVAEVFGGADGGAAWKVVSVDYDLLKPRQPTPPPRQNALLRPDPRYLVLLRHTPVVLAGSAPAATEKPTRRRRQSAPRPVPVRITAGTHTVVLLRGEPATVRGGASLAVLPRSVPGLRRRRARVRAEWGAALKAQVLLDDVLLLPDRGIDDTAALRRHLQEQLGRGGKP